VTNIDHEMFSSRSKREPQGYFFTDAARSAWRRRALQWLGSEFFDFDKRLAPQSISARHVHRDELEYRLAGRRRFATKNRCCCFATTATPAQRQPAGRAGVLPDVFVPRGGRGGDYNNDGPWTSSSSAMATARWLLANTAGAGNQDNHWVGVNWQAFRCKSHAMAHGFTLIVRRRAGAGRSRKPKKLRRQLPSRRTKNPPLAECSSPLSRCGHKLSIGWKQLAGARV